MPANAERSANVRAVSILKLADFLVQNLQALSNRGVLIHSSRLGICVFVPNLLVGALHGIRVAIIAWWHPLPVPPNP